jgi:hypothetical protein
VKTPHTHHLLCLFLAAIMTSCSSHRDPLEAQIARFAPASITADISRLSPGDRIALHKLIAAARLMDTLYHQQVWAGNHALRERLEADHSPAGQLLLRYYDINLSPWSALDHDTVFVPGAPAKPAGANYYPPDMTKEEFQKWTSTLPAAEQALATGFFTTIRRDTAGHLRIVPYNEEYKALLAPAAQLLREAAQATDNPSLKKFLELRADAFLSNDYYASDVAWLDTDSPLEVTIGPYEVYMDELFNYKAAFEAFIALRDDAETAKLEMFSRELQDVENHLPIDPAMRNPSLGALAPIRVVDEITTGGEPRAGVQTAAYNLPNDERVTREKGSKRVMLKNVQEAKFTTILLPIASRVLDPAQRSLVAFDPFFTHILAHELMHGLGPHTITVNGQRTTARQAMKDLSSAMEEAKADISGLFMLQYLMDKGVVLKSLEQPLYVTYLAGVFRSIRFGINDAHGRGMALQFNYMEDAGAFLFDPASSTYRVDIAKAKDAARALTGIIMTIQATGDYAGAQALLDRYAVVRPQMQRVLASLADIPVDIKPDFPLATP